MGSAFCLLVSTPARFTNFTDFKHLVEEHALAVEVGSCNLTVVECLAREVKVLQYEAESAVLGMTTAKGAFSASAQHTVARARNASAMAEALVETAVANAWKATEVVTARADLALGQAINATVEAQAQGEVIVGEAARETRTALNAAWTGAQRELEAQLGCTLSDVQCLRGVGEETHAKAAHLLSDSQRRFETSIGCRLADSVCLKRQASELAAQASLQTAEMAHEARQGALVVVGCVNATDVEGCVLRRAQELAVALSILASTTSLAVPVGLAAPPIT